MDLCRKRWEPGPFGGCSWAGGGFTQLHCSNTWNFHDFFNMLKKPNNNETPKVSMTLFKRLFFVIPIWIFLMVEHQWLHEDSFVDHLADAQKWKTCHGTWTKNYCTRKIDPLRDHIMISDIRMIYTFVYTHMIFFIYTTLLIKYHITSCDIKPYYPVISHPMISFHLISSYVIS